MIFVHFLQVTYAASDNDIQQIGTQMSDKE